ncbi:PspC domain-containing protein [Lutibacter holmesii]|uniref:PspC domain-containing protein n=1 Tax=Lutibacter holmesii TaxID=1137985 RepID=A0ABW3WQT4_9FLAO
MTNNKAFTRSENRIIGGVCSAISRKYNLPNWILRTIFIITSIIMTFPILIYLILWLIIPNRKLTEQVSKKRKYLLQSIGFIIGGIIGWFAGYGLGLIAINGDNSGGIVVFIFALIGIPTGAIIGFSISRIKAERNTLSDNT